MSESLATLLATGKHAESNRKLLEKNHFQLQETKLRDGSTKYQISDPAKNTRKIIDLLIKEGKGLEETNLPLDRISQLIGDEIDYSAIIPASAIASAQGKSTESYGLKSYYEKIANGEKIDWTDYSYLGITEQKLAKDIKS